MAKQITQLTGASNPAGTDLLWLEQSGLPRKLTLTSLKDYVRDNIADTYAPVAGLGDYLESSPTRDSSPYINFDTTVAEGIYKTHSHVNHTGHPSDGVGYGMLQVIDNLDVHAQLFYSRRFNGTLYYRNAATSDFTSVAWREVAMLDGGTFTGSVTFNEQVGLGNSAGRLICNDTGNSNTRFWFAGRNAGDTDYRFDAEFGWDQANQRWYFDDTLLVSGTLTADGVPVQQTTLAASGYEYYTVNNASVTAGSWYTIATDPSALDITTTPVGKTGGTRAAAKFKIWDATSGQHGFIEFTVSVHFGRRPAITIHNSSGYGSDALPIRGIRTVRYGTYEGTAVQVQAAATGTLYCAVHTQGGTSNVFAPRDFLAQTPNATWYVEDIDYLDYGSRLPTWGAFARPATATDTYMNGIAFTGDGRFYPAGPNGGYFTENGETYCTLKLNGARSGYVGISLAPDGSGTHQIAVMSDGNSAGFYNDTDNQWLFYGTSNGDCRLHYNGTATIITTAYGARYSGQGAYLHYASSTYANGGKITIGTSAPGSPQTGDLWFDTS